jgi:predicted lipoprotein with Yx(FWY)xxD motif
MRTTHTRIDRRIGASLVGLILIVAACSSAGSGAGVGAYGGAGISAAPTVAPASAAVAVPASAPASAASGGGGKYSSGGGDYGSPATAAPSASSQGGGAAEAYVVSVGNGKVGAFLTGEDGKTLYVFKKDSANTSACTGDCTTNWPPFTIDPDETVTPGDGVTGALTTFARADGTLQVAHGGAPLYYFAGDSAAGDTKGQGIGGNWSVATP